MHNARTILKVLAWVWIVLVLPFAWVSIQVIEQLSRKGFPQNLYDTTLGFLFLPGLPIFLTCSVLGALLLATILTGILVLHSKQDEAPASSGSIITTNTVRDNQGTASQIGSAGIAMIIQNSPGAIIHSPPPQTDTTTLVAEQQKALLHRYLNNMISKNKDLNPTGIHQPQALLSVNVPLDEIFIHIRAVSDRPVFDIGIEQQKLLEEIELVRHRSDLDPHEREEYIQYLRAAVWHSQLGEELLMIRLGKDVKIEEVLQRLTRDRPVAVLLGSPGSGKSTTMRWLALQMARASCHTDYELPQDLAPIQLPLFLTIGDYAKAISATPSGSYQITSVKEFFYQEWKKISSDLPALLEDALLKGHCLLLFDGLDEVASDSLRSRVRKDLFDFISIYPSQQDITRAYNRVLITSRIVGYEPGPFGPFAQYTLLDLNDTQIQQFLKTWCPAVELYQARSLQGMKEELTLQQAQRVQQEGQSQCARLLDALQYNPGIRRLAVNPLMLTILALIQKSGRRLPHRRIELYQAITLTLLNNWNQFRGRVIFSPEEIDLAEEVLSEFAYRLHSRDLPLTEKDVFAVTRETMARYYNKTTEQIQRSTVEIFIETLRSSSSIFVERGQGLYGFIHRTFQEYYVMRYLVDTQHYPLVDPLLTASEDLKAFVVQKCHISTWHEPLLLLIAYKSEQKDRNERQQANTLIQTILAAHESYDSYLQRQLLLAASALTDCNTWYIDISLQQVVANQLFDIFGDLYGVGRYTELQKDIEKIALLWLRSQPQGSNLQPPLLESWYAALCDSTRAQRQYGAAVLLTTIAHDLPTCPAVVLHILIPPLLHLAGVQDWYRQELTCPPEILSRLLTTSAYPSSSSVSDCAFVALRLLGEQGPAGWLHRDWLKWSEEQPDLPQRLTHYALELRYLLTPVIFFRTSADSNWIKQREIRDRWQDLAQRDPYSLQMASLQASSTASYPYALLLKRLLSSERSSSSLTWQEVWDSSLQNEMRQGHVATYQSCLLLRFLLAANDRQRQQRLVSSLLYEIEAPVTQMQALKTLANLYMIYELYRPYWRDTLIKIYTLRVIDMLDAIDALDVLVLLREASWTPDVDYKIHAQGAMGLLDSENGLARIELEHLFDKLDSVIVLDLLNREELVQILCSVLQTAKAEVITSALFALSCVLTSFDQVPFQLSQQVQQAITTLERQETTAERRQLLGVLQRRLSGAQAMSHTPKPFPPGTPDQRILYLHTLQQQQPVLNMSNVVEILTSCTDTRKATEETWRRMNPHLSRWAGNSVGGYAWQMLSLAWSMDKAAQQTVIRALDDENSLICAAAAQLLEHGKDLALEIRQAAGTTIMRILANAEYSRRTFNPPQWSEWGPSERLRLDDMLFKTLRVLAEGKN